MEKTKHLVAQIVLVIVIIYLYYIELSRDQARIIESLKTFSPLFLDITLIIIAILAAVSLSELSVFFSQITKRQWIILAVVLALSFSLVCFIAPRTHRIYYDENIYLHIGQSIALTQKAQMVNFGEIKYGELIVGQSEYNKQPNSYPHILSIFYRIFGCSETLSFLLNNLFFILSALVLFLIGFMLYDSFKIGLYSALVFIVIPQNLLWFNTTSVEPAATLFITLAVLMTLLFCKSGRLSHLMLGMAIACYASQFRMESLLVIPLVLIILVLKRSDFIKDQKLYYSIPLVLFLLLPHVLHLISFQSHPWGASQVKYSISFLSNNLRTNGMFFLNNKDFPLILTLFFLISFLSLKYIKERLVFFTWTLLFWGVFLFFYAGSYYYGADMRFVLMCLPPFSLLSAIGLSKFDERIHIATKKRLFFGLAIIFFAFITFLPKSRTVGQEAWAARFDHLYAQKMLSKIPKNGIVFTHNPSMFLFWGRSSAQASILASYDPAALHSLKNNFPGGVYFHFNFWCNVSDPLQQSFCKGILDKFPNKEVMKFKERDYSYILYKIE